MQVLVTSSSDLGGVQLKHLVAIFTQVVQGDVQYPQLGELMNLPSTRHVEQVFVDESKYISPAVLQVRQLFAAPPLQLRQPELHG